MDDPQPFEVHQVDLSDSVGPETVIVTTTDVTETAVVETTEETITVTEADLATLHDAVSSVEHVVLPQHVIPVKVLPGSVGLVGGSLVSAPPVATVSVSAKPITIQAMPITVPSPRGKPSSAPIVTSASSSTGSAAQPQPHMSSRPTILQSKPALLKRGGSDITSPAVVVTGNAGSLTLGNIVTADGTTTLKLTGSGSPAPSGKHPNIIRPTSVPQQSATNVVQKVVEKTDIDGNEKTADDEPRQSLQQQQQHSVQIFPLGSTPGSAASGTVGSSGLVCLSIVNGKIQKVPTESGEAAVCAEAEVEFLSESESDLNLLTPLPGVTVEENSRSAAQVDVDQVKLRLEDVGLKCCTNEFNAVEVGSNKRNVTNDDDNNNIDDEDEEDEDIGLSCREEPPPSPGKIGSTGSQPAGPRLLRDNNILCCGGCGCYGMASEFFNGEACSKECKNRIAAKRREKERRERELKLQKSRREAKKRERELDQILMRQQQQQQLGQQNEQEKQIRQPPQQHDQAQGMIDSRQIKEENDDDDEQEKDENLSNPTVEVLNQPPPPWNAEASFNWDAYLESSGSKAAPSKLFKCPFPTGDNLFEPGMKLEAIDPEHPSLICVVTVAEVVGYRLRLHFDDYSDSYDFWENANSPNIFHAGWCEENGQELQTPSNFSGREFRWNSYLKQTSSVAAPKSAFEQRPEPGDLSGWRVGLKLEAVDRQNTSLVCVATVANLMDGRILIHFDGWEVDFDYWTTPSSPYIHPLGWCEQNVVKLNPPKGYVGDFTWEKYLKETRSLPAPNWAFKPPRSEVSLFRKGMKLEAVDKRNPSLIGVASVADVLMHQIKIHFDGWTNNYDFWVEDTSPDIHPPTWCAKTGHPLMPPLTTQEVLYLLSRGGCQTPGCRGVGHIKGAKFFTHHTTANCPYLPGNLDNESLLPDRLQPAAGPDKSFQQTSGGNGETAKERSATSSLGRGNRKRKPRKFFDDDERGGSAEVQSSSPTLPADQQNAKQRRLAGSLSKTSMTGSARPSGKNSDGSSGDLRAEVFNPGWSYKAPEIDAAAWQKNSSFLRSRVSQLTVPEVSSWSPHHVAEFIASLPGVRLLSGDDPLQRIIAEEIDGQAFLLLTQSDLVSIGLKLGPAIKVFNAILLIQGQGLPSRDLQCNAG